MPLGTPYITPALLENAQTGVSWELIPQPGSTTAAQLAELTNICWRSTSIVDTYCNQVLRATIDNEYITGPGAPRMSVQRDTGNGLLVMRRWPVIEVLAIQLSSNRSFPRAWTTVPAGQFDVTHPLINSLTNTAAATAPDGGSLVEVAPGYIPPLACGRNSTRALVSYANGWPHASLTAGVSAGTSILPVDDVTGFAGASAFVYDGADTEVVAVESMSAATPLALPNGVGTAQTGPGTVTLAAPLAYAHGSGVMVSALPPNVIWAAALAAAAQALESGITSISVSSMPGAISEGGHGVDDLKTEYELLLEPFRRVI